MKKTIIFFLILSVVINASAQDNTIRNGGEYYLYNTYYGRCFGANEAYNGFALSSLGTQDNSNYVWVAEASTLDEGYYWLHLKGTTKYLQASNDPNNTWSVWMAGSLNKAYNSYEWMPVGGISGYIKSKRGEVINSEGNAWLAPDPDKETNTYINVYFNKPQSARSVWQIVDANYPLEQGRLKLYTDELDNAISAGEDVYENPVFGSKGEKDELAISLYNARSAKETASLDDTETMTNAIEALKSATNNVMEKNYSIWISGSNFGTNTAFTVAMKSVSFTEESSNGEVRMLIRNTKKTGATIYLGNDHVTIGNKVMTLTDAKDTNDWQFAFNGTDVSVYGNGTLLGTAPQETVAPLTSVGTAAEWTAFGINALKSYTPEIVSYNFSYAPGEYYQENNKSKDTALKLIGTNLTISEPMDYHILAASNTLSNSTINLTDKDAWVIFDNVRPSDVINNHLKNIKINGANASNGTNCRVAIYLQGAVVYPFSNSDVALYGYSGQQYTGNEYTFTLGRNDEMGEAANNIQSFILKRGYMVCFSTNADGSGYSRVYVADHDDKKIDNLPAELSRRISRAYIRKWNWVSKKGWSSTESTGAINTEGKLVGATWFYTWGADRSTQTDMEYVPTKQHIYWPSYSAIDQTNSTACLGLNEPDHSEQHDNCDCKGTIDTWKATTMMPDFLASGLRIGSPAPTDASWLSSFIGHVNDMAYRCDFVAFHSYWGSNEASNSDAWWSCLNSIYQSTKRPIWLTEWNNGASWTSESWPSSYSDRLTYQMNKIKSILSVLDNADFIERYAIYNWDYGMPRMVMSWDSNKNNWWVTPCGEVYRDTHPTHAYQEKMQYVPHYWWPSLKKEGNTLSFTLKSVGRKLNLTSTNQNGDVTESETLEYKDEDTGEWKIFHDNPFPRNTLDIKGDRNTTVALDECTIDPLIQNTITLRLKIKTVKGEEVITEPFTANNTNYIINHYSNIVGVSSVTVDDKAVISAGNGYVTITSNAPENISIYNTSGTLIYQEITDGTTQIPLPSGVYLINGMKYSVK